MMRNLSVKITQNLASLQGHKYLTKEILQGFMPNNIHEKKGGRKVCAEASNENNWLQERSSG